MQLKDRFKWAHFVKRDTFVRDVYIKAYILVLQQSEHCGFVVRAMSCYRIRHYVDIANMFVLAPVLI